ncbi:MAG TPA: CHASE3 domain-containing protein [Alphaproteobacteria bacterium]|nr:CHASE3 domain-containing protein [Alphaproteobacteria bacterium]
MFSRIPNDKPRPGWARYGVAVACVVLGLAAREGLSPWIGPTALAFTFFFPAAALAAWFGRFGAGLLATLLSAVLADWFFIAPVHSLVIGNFRDIPELGAFVLSCAFIVGAIEAMHRANARERAEIRERQRVEAELARVRKQFASTLGGIGGAIPPPNRAPFLRLDGRTKPAARFITFWFLSAAALLVCSTILVYRWGQIPVGAHEKMAGHLLVLQQLGDFLSAMKDTETGERGYLLTGDEAYLQPYTNTRQVVSIKLDGLKRLELSGDLPKDKVERVAALTSEKLSLLEQGIQLRRQKGLDAALASMRGEKGERAMDMIRANIAEMRATEEKEFAAAKQRADRAEYTRTGTFVAMCLANLMFLGWAFHTISREMHRGEIARLETRQQKELLETTLASIGDAVIATDAEGCVVFLNSQAEALTGWKIAEAAGRPLPEVFRIFHEETRKVVENPVEKALRLGGVVALANHTILISKDGREIPIDDSAAPIRQPDGPLFGVVLVFRDVTAERVAREISQRKQIEARVAGAQEAERARVARDLHDGVGQQLGGALFLSDLLRRDLAERAAVESSRAADVHALIVAALNQVREVSREFYPVPAEPDGLMMALQNLAARVAHDRKMDCVFDPDSAELPDNPALSNHLYRIAQEAVNNALKHSGATRIVLKLAANADYVELSVCDNGAGLPPDGRAAGLGLQTMRDRASLIGGKFVIENAPEGGVRVTCSVIKPAAIPTPGAPESPNPKTT